MQQWQYQRERFRKEGVAIAVPTGRSILLTASNVLNVMSPDYHIAYAPTAGIIKAVRLWKLKLSSF
jgi:hypothetical protein